MFGHKDPPARTSRHSDLPASMQICLSIRPSVCQPKRPSARHSDRHLINRSSNPSFAKPPPVRPPARRIANMIACLFTCIIVYICPTNKLPACRSSEPIDEIYPSKDLPARPQIHPPTDPPARRPINPLAYSSTSSTRTPISMLIKSVEKGFCLVGIVLNKTRG